MKMMVDKGKALDVMVIGEVFIILKPKIYIYKLNEFHEGKDYCDPKRDRWIWSIGRDKKTGDIFASTDSRFYCNEEYECLWLR